MIDEFATTGRVVGGGYIGPETAAVLSKTGKHVTVQGAARSRAGEPLSRFQ